MREIAGRKFSKMKVCRWTYAKPLPEKFNFRKCTAA